MKKQEIKKEEPQNFQMQLDMSHDAFYANSLIVAHNKNNFFLDFRQMINRAADPNGEATVVPIKSRLVMVDKEWIKGIIKSLEENVKRYEKANGKIPEFKEEKKAKKEIKKETSASYFG